jgi:peptidylprolyl isomerase
MYKVFLFIILIAVISGCSKKEDPSNEITTSSGLKYIDLVIGTGPSPQVGQDVTIHYTGTLLDGKKFDSSKDRNTPYKFTIGMGQTLLGWDEGVISMKVGGKRKLIVPPELAYGSTGVRTVIPPNTTVVFEIELLDVKDHR